MVSWAYRKRDANHNDDKGMGEKYEQIEQL